jgi:hypothetical protein
VGEIRRVPLSDGSMAAINTDTVLDVSMRPRLRQVKLDKGEAWFQVAKDRAAAVRGRERPGAGAGRRHGLFGAPPRGRQRGPGDRGRGRGLVATTSAPRRAA